MKNTCCVPQCESKRSSVKLHRFPKQEIGLKWVKFINCASLKKLGIEELQKLFVCHKHFEQKFVTGSLRLRHSAYPTLFSAIEIQSGIPAVEFENSENQSVRDHDYTQRKRRHEEHTYCKTQTLKSLANMPSTTISLEEIVSGKTKQQLSVADLPRFSNVVVKHKKAMRKIFLLEIKI